MSLNHAYTKALILLAAESSRRPEPSTLDITERHFINVRFCNKRKGLLFLWISALQKHIA